MEHEGCFILQYSDLTVCKTCGLKWDTGDINPPRCGSPVRVVQEESKDLDGVLPFITGIFLGFFLCMFVIMYIPIGG